MLSPNPAKVYWEMGLKEQRVLPGIFTAAGTARPQTPRKKYREHLANGVLSFFSYYEYAAHSSLCICAVFADELPGRPCPREIIPAAVAVRIQNLSAEKQPRTDL